MSHVKTMTVSSKSRGRVVKTFPNISQLKTRGFHPLIQFCCLKTEDIKSYFGLILGVAQVSRGCGARGVFSMQGKRKRRDIVNLTSCWYWWVYPGNVQLLCLIAQHLGICRLPNKSLSLWSSLPYVPWDLCAFPQGFSFHLSTLLFIQDLALSQERVRLNFFGTDLWRKWRASSN